MKKEITVEIIGEPSEEAIEEFHKRLALAIFNKLGIEKTKAVLELMNNKEKSNDILNENNKGND